MPAGPETRSRDWGASRGVAVPQLLARIWDDALDPGYAAAAARTAGRPRPHKRKLWAGLSLALVGVLLAAAIVQADAARPAVAQRRLDLIARIQAQTSRYDSVTGATAALQQQVDRLKSTALGATGAGQQLDKRLGELELGAAQVAVTGPGLTVTLDDATAPAPGTATNPALGRVLDRDLQMVVNGLWAAGAEAVSVNGERLTALSAIRSAGDAILVDYRPLTRPYRVVAIGNPQTIQAAFGSGAAGSGLRTLQQTYGVQYDVHGVVQVTVPAAASLTLRYAKVGSQ